MIDFKTRLKHLLFQLAGKDPEAVVVSFLSGPSDKALAMVEEVRRLVPDREHFAVAAGTPPQIEGVRCLRADEARRELRRRRIGLAPVLFTADREFAALRRLAVRLAPTRILAYNERLERHHLRLRTCVASMLFLRGVPLDRIYLRPHWLWPWKSDRSIVPETYTEFAGRPPSAGKRRIGVLTPYFPYPLSHGGAVRMYNLLREASRDFDLYLFAFSDPIAPEHMAEMQKICARILIFPKPRYREPRWSSLAPPEVDEYRSDAVARIVESARRVHSIELLQVEYTQLATYAGDILVEHDVTFDLYRQVRERAATWTAWWDWWRWQRFERAAVERFRAVAVMSEKDRSLLGLPQARVIPNGVDLERFAPQPERPGHRLLFVGSFAHFPNIVAYRFFTEKVWTSVLKRIPDASLVVVAGPTPELYWAAQAGSAAPPPVERVDLHSFVADVRPLYHDTNLVIVPTRVSAGTNLKVLEAMALQRAVVSTPSGCAGLGLKHAESVWVAEGADEFAEGVVRLLCEVELRASIAGKARQLAESHYGWDRIAGEQRQLWNSLLPKLEIRIRTGTRADLDRVDQIQFCGHGAAHWDPATYLEYDLAVASVGPTIAGFMVTRRTAPRELEILNIAVAPEFRRCGVATALIQHLQTSEIFLEVRESNSAARKFYEKLGFEAAGRRPGYYDDPPEAAVVMRLDRKGDPAS